MMDWTTKVQIRILAYSIFKVLLFPLWLPVWIMLWPIKTLYRSEKKKYLEEGALTDQQLDDEVKQLSQTSFSATEIRLAEEKPKSDWTISIIDANGQTIATKPAYLDEDAKARVDFYITKTTMAMKSQLKCKGKVIVTSKIAPKHNGTYGVAVMPGDLLKVDHTWVPGEATDKYVTSKELQIHEMGATPKSARPLIDAANSVDYKAESRIRILYEQGRSVLHIAKVTHRSRDYVKSVLGLKPERKAVLTVLDSCGRARQHVEVRGKIFDQCIEARKFQATIRAKESFVVGAVTLENWEGKIVCKEGRHLCLGYEDSYCISLDIDDADIKYLGGEKELQWGGCPISALDDKHLYNIYQAVLNKQWVNGQYVTFASPMQKALTKEYNKRNFSYSRKQEFMRMNKAWEAANS